MGNFKNLDFLQNYKFTLDFSKIRDIIYTLNLKISHRKSKVGLSKAY